jgi:hypothetical protein
MHDADESLTAVRSEGNFFFKHDLLKSWLEAL